MLNKKYLIDIPHPHFVHFFKNVIKKIGEEKVVITCQDSGIIVKLLEEEKFNYIIIGKKYNGLISKALGQLKYFFRYYKLIKKKNIDAVLGMSPAILFAARLTNKRIFFFDDDDSAVQPLTKRITLPLASMIITPKCLAFENYGKRHFMYDGYQELAYLAPEYFTPNLEILKKYGLVPKSYFILRFNDFIAHHDVGHSGIPNQLKHDLVNILNQYGQVFITSESTLEDDFAKYQLKVNPVDIHHILSFAKMYIGDSQTMASEAAVLGTPSIRCNTFKGKIAYLEELEHKYNLTYAFFPNEAEDLITKIEEILKNEDFIKDWMSRRNEMLSDMEDVNNFIIKTISEKND